MIVGGSTKSLLNAIDYFVKTGHDVHLALFEEGGAQFDKINNQVILHLNVYPDLFISRIKKIKQIIKSLEYLMKYLKNFVRKDFDFKQFTRHHLLMKNAQKIDMYFDISIGYLEGLSHLYCLNKTNANLKIGWIHTDLIKSKLYNYSDLEVQKQLDYTIFVDKSLLKKYTELFNISNSKFIPNILDYLDVIERSKDYDPIMPKDKINLLMVSRIDFESKGHDRIIEIINDIINKDKLQNFHLTIIGDGVDFEKLNILINKYKLKEFVTLEGMKSNPYPWIKKADLLLLPSYFEGSPTIVYESMVLGTPCFVTNYSNASSQIKNHYNGMIVNNDYKSIYQGISSVVAKKLFNSYKEGLKNYYFSNHEAEIEFDEFIIRSKER